MLDYNSWLPLWQLDYQFGLFDKDYFKGLVADNTINQAQFKEITGEDYKA